MKTDIIGRLEAWEFKMRYNDFFNPVDFHLKTMEQACNFVVNNQNWNKLLGVILSMINFINGANAARQVLGFKINALAKIIDTKSSDSKTAILDILCEMCEKSNLSECFKVVEAVNVINEASKASITSIEDELKECENGIQNLNEQIKFYEKNAPNSNDSFVKIFKNFHSDKVLDVENLRTRYNELLNTTLVSIASLYDEPVKEIQTEPEKFFLILKTFLESLAQSVEKIKDKKEVAEKARIREEEKKIREKLLMEKKQEMVRLEIVNRSKMSHNGSVFQNKNPNQSFFAGNSSSNHPRPALLQHNSSSDLQHFKNLNSDASAPASSSKYGGQNDEDAGNFAEKTFQGLKSGEFFRRKKPSIFKKLDNELKSQLEL